MSKHPPSILTAREEEIIRRVVEAKSRTMEGQEELAELHLAVKLSQERQEKIETLIGKAALDVMGTVIFAAGGGRVSRPPAHRLSEVLRFVFPKKAFDRVFSQIILDMREEYFEALAEGAVWKAKLRHAQLWWALASATVMWFAASSLRRMYDFWKSLSI